MNPVVVRVQDPQVFGMIDNLFDRLSSGKADIPYSKDQFLDYVLTHLYNPDFSLWLAVDGDSHEVLGFAAVSVTPQEMTNKREAYVDLAYLDSKVWSSGAAQIALERIEQWARLRNAVILKAGVGRGVKALVRKFGFDVDTHVLSKDLTNGQA